MAFRRVALLSEIPTDAGLGITVGGEKIGLYRLGERLYAMQDVCPHAGTLLHPGILIGTLVVCPGHGWEFDLATGLAPGERDEEPLTRYPVRVVGEEVHVDIDAPLRP